MMQFPELYLKNRLTTGKDLSRLIFLTIVCTISVIPPFIAATSTDIEQFFGIVSLGIYIELFYLSVLFMPTALGMLGLLHFVTRNPDKKIEYGSYGYLIGFATGFFLLLSLFGLPIGSLVLLAAVGYAAGIALSFISKRSHKMRVGAPICA